MEDRKEICVSIIVLVYNVEEYLERCLHSITAQTHQKLDIVVIDGGSQDKSLGIIKDFQKRDSRIRLICREGGGISCARNTGLDEAKGEWIYFVDSDDRMEENAIEFLLQAALKASTAVSMGAYYCYRYAGKKVKKQRIHFTEGTFRGEELMAYEYRGCRGDDHLWCRLFHRSVFEKLRFPENKIYEDAWMMPFLLREAGSCTVIDCPVYHYYFREGNTCNSQTIQAHMQLLEARYAGKALMEESYPQLAGDAGGLLIEACCMLFERMNRYGRRNCIKEWNEVSGVFEKEMAGAVKDSMYRRGAVFLFRLSPVLLAKFCSMYVALKSRL
ncbi:MAG: glycosyltransferase [Roseburia sp.]|nr:glycosyltransferase [Roseburia sp.]